MKKYIFIAGLALLFAASCSKEIDNQINNNTLVPVTVSVNDFSIEMVDFPQTRATTPLGSYGGAKAITLAFYTNDGTECYKATQIKADEETYTTFGYFSLNLPVGSYTMVILGYGLYDDDVFTLTSPTLAGFSGDVRETLVAKESVNITSSAAVNLSTTLNRIVSKLQVVSTDGKAANVNKVRMTFSAGGKQFSPSNGLATLNTGTVSTVSNSSEVGSTSSSVGYVFLATDEQTMNVTIETLDAGGNTLYSTVVENVPFKRNRCTKLSGSLYPTAGATSSFQVNTSWLDPEEMDF